MAKLSEQLQRPERIHSKLQPSFPTLIHFHLAESTIPPTLRSTDTQVVSHAHSQAVYNAWLGSTSNPSTPQGLDSESEERNKKDMTLSGMETPKDERTLVTPVFRFGGGMKKIRYTIREVSGWGMVVFEGGGCRSKEMIGRLIRFSFPFFYGSVSSKDENLEGNHPRTVRTDPVCVL